MWYMKNFKEKQRFALRKIKSAKKAGLASVMIGLSLMGPATGIVQSVAVHADTVNANQEQEKSSGVTDVTKNTTDFDKLLSSDKTQNLSKVETALYKDNKDNTAIATKDDNFNNADLEALVKLAKSDSWESKINGGDDEDMVIAHDAIDDAEYLLKGEDPDSIKVEGADTMDVDRSARYDKKKTPKKFTSADEWNKKINETTKKLKKAMIALDYEDKFELNSMIKRTEELIEQKKISDQALPTVQNALLNAKKVAGDLQATNQNVWDAEHALSDALNLAGFNFEVDDDNTDNDIVITSKLDGKEILGKMSNYNDQHRPDEQEDLKADDALNSADNDFNDSQTANIADNTGATLDGQNSNSTSTPKASDDATSLVEQGDSIAKSTNTASDGLYNYDTDKQKVEGDVDNPVTVTKADDETALDNAVKKADSDDEKLKSKLADSNTQKALNDAIDEAKNVDKSDKEAVKKADADLLAAMNSVDTQAKAVATKQLAQLNDVASQRDFKKLSADNQAVVANTQTLLSNAIANPNASFADIVQAETAALNVLDQANKTIAPSANQVAKQAEITQTLAKQNANINDHTTESQINHAVDTAISAIKADANDTKDADSDLAKVNDKLVEVQKDAIAAQPKLAGDDAKVAASDTNLKSSDSVAMDGGVKADNIGATSATMNSQADNAAPVSTNKPAEIVTPSEVKDH